MGSTSYAVALGSNRRHGRFGAPASVVAAAIEAVGALGKIEGASRVHATAALGAAGRSFANAAILLASPLEPPELLAALKSIETRFGRRPGRKWGPRVLDLDIILWSEGPFADGRLVVPHAEMRGRAFVLGPLAEIAPGWTDPLTGRSVRQLLHCLRAPAPVDRASLQF